MTVSNQTKKATGTGNDSATVFSFNPIVIYQSSDLVVTLTDSDGNETTLSEGNSSTTYSVSVSSYPGTGSITYPASGGTPLATGSTLTIKRVLTLEQDLDLNNQGPYFAELQETALDKLVMIDLQQQEEIDRAFRFPIGYTGSISIETNTPVAGRFLRVNSGGTALEWAATTSGTATAGSSSPEDVSLSAAAVGSADDYAREDHVHLLPTVSVAKGGTGATTASGARTALGVVIGSDVQAYDADTAKLDVAQTWSENQTLADNELIRPVLKDYGEKVNAIGSIGGGTQDIDLELGNVVSATVDTSTTTFTFSNPPASGTEGGFKLYLTNGGSQTVNWPASVDWAGGTEPTLTTSGVDILIFTTIDGGTTWYGFVAGADMK